MILAELPAPVWHHICRLLLRLPARAVDIFMLRACGWTQAAIAIHLGVSQFTVSHDLNHACLPIRTYLRQRVAQAAAQR